MKKLKEIPNFKTAEEEGKFWLTHDTTDYIDWSKAKIGFFPNLHPTTRLISIRFPEHLLSQLKVRASKLDVPYQSLIKEYVRVCLNQDCLVR